MFFSAYNELEKFTNEAISAKIIGLKKELFELRLKKATKQSFKPHLFKHIKRKIAQLHTFQTKKKSDFKVNF
uniref:Large ribosomal subunit protein uL29c n=1 Tax=Cryptomonas sp. SAG 977-2f TaxID=279061 RepID=A0A679CBM5_9CRYP|nr:ribosomal protein L29 [Cryptomonas sp. SAG 977-2f]